MTRKEERWRQEGLSFCSRYLQAHNYDGKELEAEIRRRMSYNIPVGITKAQEEDLVGRVRKMVLDTVLIMSMNVLRDEFDFGPKRLNRFKRRFNSKSECIIDDYASWKDLQQVLLDECGIETEIRYNN